MVADKFKYKRHIYIYIQAEIFACRENSSYICHEEKWKCKCYLLGLIETRGPLYGTTWGSTIKVLSSGCSGEGKVILKKV